MINQHLEMAIAELQEFIDGRPDAREVKKALCRETGLSRLQVRRNSNNFRCICGFNNKLEASLQGIWNLRTALKL